MNDKIFPAPTEAQAKLFRALSGVETHAIAADRQDGSFLWHWEHTVPVRIGSITTTACAAEYEGVAYVERDGSYTLSVLVTLDMGPDAAPRYVTHEADCPEIIEPMVRAHIDRHHYADICEAQRYAGGDMREDFAMDRVRGDDLQE